MAAKVLIAGLANSGKTTLTKNLKKALVISHDGKKYPFAVPHGLLTELDTTSTLVDFAVEKIEAYKEKFKEYPETIVIDSISRVYDSLYDSCNKRFNGFTIYSQLDKEIKELNDFLENDLVAAGVNLVILSHALYDAEEKSYNLVGKGSFSKTGGFLSVVDEAIFIEAKNEKRTLHFRSTKYPARTLVEELPDSMLVDKFNLQEHIDLLNARSSNVDEYEL